MENTIELIKKMENTTELIEKKWKTQDQQLVLSVLLETVWRKIVCFKAFVCESTCVHY